MAGFGQYQRFILGGLDCDNLKYTDSGFVPVSGLTGFDNRRYSFPFLPTFQAYSDANGKALFHFHDSQFYDGKGRLYKGVALLGMAESFSGAMLLPFPQGRFRILQTLDFGWQIGIQSGLYSTNLQVVRDSVRFLTLNKRVTGLTGVTYRGDSTLTFFRKITRVNDTLYLGFNDNKLFHITWDSIYLTDSLSLSTFPTPPLYETVLKSAPKNRTNNSVGFYAANESGNRAVMIRGYNISSLFCTPLCDYRQVYRYWEHMVFSIDPAKGKFIKMEGVLANRENFPYDQFADTAGKWPIGISGNGKYILTYQQVYFQSPIRRNQSNIVFYIRDLVGNERRLGTFEEINPQLVSLLGTCDNISPLGGIDFFTVDEGPDGSVLLCFYYALKNDKTNGYVQWVKIKNLNGQLSDISMGNFGNPIKRPFFNSGYIGYSPWLFTSAPRSYNIKNNLDFSTQIAYNCSATCKFVNRCDTSYRKFIFKTYYSLDTLGKTWAQHDGIDKSLVYKQQGIYSVRILGLAENGYREWWESEIEIKFPPDSIQPLMGKKPELIVATWKDEERVRVSWRKQPLSKGYSIYRFGNELAATQDTFYLDDVGSRQFQRPIAYQIKTDYGCNRLSVLSDAHETIYIGGSQNDSGNTNILEWSPYQGLQIGDYMLKRESKTIKDSIVFLGNTWKDHMLTQPESRTYFVVGNSMGGIQTRSNTIHIRPQLKLYYPSAITVNSDNLNECFEILTNSTAKGSYRIYNRWGQCAFKGDLTEKWCPGYEIADGVFVVRISVNGFETSGTLTILK